MSQILKMHWLIYDAKDDLLEESFGNIKALKKLMPWA